MGETEGAKHLFGRTRYFVLILSLLCLTFSFSNHLVFSFTVICMNDVYANATETHWLQSPTEVNSLFSAVAVGCLLGTLPITHLVQLLGVRWTCSIYGMLSALATLLFPMAVSIGYPAALIARVIQGIPVSLSYPALGQISSQWSSEKGLGSFVAILSCHMQLCSIITMPVSSAFCDSSIGWRGSFYLHGIISMIVFVGFLYFYHDQPAQHRTVSSRELERIARGKGNQDTEKRVPYGAILKDPLVWAVWLSLAGSTLGIQLFLLYGPTYMNKVLGLDIRSTGWGTALPFLLAAIVKVVVGPISDKATFVTPRTRLIFFTIISQVGMAVCLVIMSWTSSSVVAQVSYTAAIVFSGVICVGTIRGSSMVYRQHSHFVMAVSSFLLVFIVLLIPLAVVLICSNNTPAEWATLMNGTAAIVTICTIPYAILARGEPAACTQKTVSSSALNEKY